MSSASACGNTVFLDNSFVHGHRPEPLIHRAEKLMERGLYRQAMQQLFRAHPNLLRHTGKLSELEQRTVKRSRIVAAKLVGYTDGWMAVNRGGTRVEDEVFRENQIRWAIDVLDSDGVANQAMRAVLLAKTGGEGRAEARKTLERLAAEDLIPQGIAYGVLARLRAESGDADGAKRAVERCKAMSLDATNCPVP